jgi:hypothetical protein
MPSDRGFECIAKATVTALSRVEAMILCVHGNLSALRHAAVRPGRTQSDPDLRPWHFEQRPFMLRWRSCRLHRDAD